MHMIDNLGGRLGSFDRLEKELAPGERWSGFDRAIGAGAYFAAAPRRRGDARREPVARSRLRPLRARLPQARSAKPP